MSDWFVVLQHLTPPVRYEDEIQCGSWFVATMLPQLLGCVSGSVFHLSVVALALYARVYGYGVSHFVQRNVCQSGNECLESELGRIDQASRFWIT